VFLELVEVLDTLQDDDDRGQAAGHPHRASHGSHDGQRCGDRKLQEL